MNTFDCNDIINEKLKINNYDDLSFNQKKELVCKELKDYLATTIDNFYGFKNVCEHYSIQDLINYLSDSDCVIPLIKYLISIMREEQNSSIYWITYPRKKDVEINYTNNYVISIYTGNNYSYIFNYLYEYYSNKFEINNNQKIRRL